MKMFSNTYAKQKAFLCVWAIVFMFSLTAFSTVEKTEQQWSSWSKWEPSECYTGISYRYRTQSSTPAKNKIEVEVRNTYQWAVSVSTRITENPYEQTIYRLEIPSGETYITQSFIDKGKQFYFLHREVRFAGDKYGDPYRPCDKKQ